MTEKYRLFLERLVSCPRGIKRLILGAFDTTAILFSLWLAYYLRLGIVFIPKENQYWIFIVAPLIAIPIFTYFGLYRAITRYLGMRAIWDIVRSTALFTIIFAVVVLIFKTDEFVPRTIYGILGLLVLIFVGGFRLSIRWWVGRYITKQYMLGPMRHSPPVIIYGAGGAGMEVAAAMKLSKQLSPVAFIDDDKSLHRQQINGFTVYPFSRLTYLIEKYHVSDVLLAMPSIPKQKLASIISKLEPYPIHVRSLPSLSELAEGKVSIADIREVEIGDLLGREPVEPITELLAANISEKVVMVTGAGGSIGAELCRQIVKLKPKSLILFELNEFALYEVERQLAIHLPEIEIQAVIGNVINKRRVKAICKQFGVNTIYHAAAYKHVPLVEKNTTEALFNNVFGTRRCAEAAIEACVETFVLISTDKAVRPTNTMGATKRLAEMVLQTFALEEKHTTRFTMVRFGNVLGSSGSVVPLFRQQIAAGGPVTVTDERITRYFMTIPEAAELVIQAGAMGQGGDVFVLDMGEPVKILDLAKKMIHLSGFSERTERQPDGDVKIEITGLRPGEKLFEELLIGDDVVETIHPKIMRAQEKMVSSDELNGYLSQLEQAYEANDCKRIREVLLTVVDEYAPQCDVQDWLKASNH